MTPPRSTEPAVRAGQEVSTELLILSDGTILAHNLTPAMAAVLNQLNPKDQALKLRAFAARYVLGSERRHAARGAGRNPLVPDELPN